MKKAICCLLILSILSVFSSCDQSYLCSLDILSANENVSIIVGEETLKSFNFFSKAFNHQPKEYYVNIDFSNGEADRSNAQKYTFDIIASADESYRLSMELIDANRYVVDLLRIGILVDADLKVYKYYDKYEQLYHKENDPDTINHFVSQSKIFNDLHIDIDRGEAKEITVFIWIEESELYSKSGERHTGWSDKSYKATPISLRLDIN